MVIREKRLVSLMKDAYKAGGYTVAVRENGKTVISASRWAVETDNASVPREALSMMALHMGFLPESGEAYRIYKGHKEADVQSEILTSAVEFITGLETLRLEARSGETGIMKTILTYNGYSVWQQTQNGHILLVDPALELLLYKKDDICRVGGALYGADGESSVYILCQPEADYRKSLDHLAEITWPTVI